MTNYTYDQLLAEADGYRGYAGSGHGLIIQLADMLRAKHDECQRLRRYGLRLIEGLEAQQQWEKLYGENSVLADYLDDFKKEASK